VEEMQDFKLQVEQTELEEKVKQVVKSKDNLIIRPSKKSLEHIEEVEEND